MQPTLKELRNSAERIVYKINPVFKKDDEIVSAVMAILMKIRDKVDHTLPTAKNYIFKCCSREIYRVFNERKRNRLLTNLKYFPKTNDSSYNQSAIDELLEILDKNSKHIVIERVIFRKSFAVIAKEMGRREGYVTKRYHKAIERLRTYEDNY